MGDDEDEERKLRERALPTSEPGKPVSGYPLCGARICFRASQLYSPRNAPRYVVSFLGDIGYPAAGLDMAAWRDGAISGDGD
jgi:hypothetical protein